MKLVSAWEQISKLPASGKIFNVVLRALVPYTGSLGAEVEELKGGYAKVKLRDRRAVRNHLKSIHAMALSNLCEATSGLAMMSILPENMKAILVSFSIEYSKKARGTLTCECRCTLPPILGRTQHTLEAIAKNQSGDIVCQAKAHWLIQPKS
jgi:acyl-coenzyme A thioesterase PaaI-like protein